MKTTSHRWWKWLFLLLASLNIITAVFLFFWISTEEPQHKMENNRHTNEEESFEEYLSIHMTSSQLEKLLNDELEGMDASIYDNHIRISSSYQLLGRTIQIFMDFVPEIHNGNIVLNETGFTAGNLPLSGSRVLSLMQQQSSLPSYIEIQSSRSRVLIHLDELSIADTYEVKAEMFNLEDDKITFLLGKTESQ